MTRVIIDIETHGTCSKCDELRGRIFEESEAAIFYKAAAVTNRQRAEIAEREVKRLQEALEQTESKKSSTNNTNNSIKWSNDCSCLSEGDLYP